MGDGGFAVRTEGLRKKYGSADLPALDGVDLAVREGGVCALLGPNGAGKTTAVRILATLLRPDGGRAEVAGLDVARHPAEVRRRIGLVGQHAAVDEVLTGRENLVMFGRLHHLGARAARRRSDELLERFGLAAAAERPARQYSGGMRRRLDLAAGLILAPAVLFLDEPTTGLDPRGRNEVWESIRSLVAAGTTVLLTTQYLDEADQLAGQVTVLDRGRVIADGSPAQLKSLVGGDRIDVVLHSSEDLPAAAALLARVAGTPVGVVADERRVSARVADRLGALTQVVRALHEDGRITAQDVALRRPTLDEVFLHLTGGRAAEEVPGVSELASEPWAQRVHEAPTEHRGMAAGGAGGAGEHRGMAAGGAGGAGEHRGMAAGGAGGAGEHRGMAAGGAGGAGEHRGMAAGGAGGAGEHSEGVR